VTWDQHLIAELEGPSLIFRKVALAVWTANARDTRPIAEEVGFKGERHKPLYRSVTSLDVERLPTFN